RRARRMAGARRPRRVAGEDLPGGAARRARAGRGADRDLRQPRPHLRRGRGAGGLRVRGAGRGADLAGDLAGAAAAAPVAGRRRQGGAAGARARAGGRGRRREVSVPFERRFLRRFLAELPFGTCVGVALPEGPAFELPAALHPGEAAFARAVPEATRAAWVG